MNRKEKGERKLPAHIIFLPQTERECERARGQKVEAADGELRNAIKSDVVTELM